MKKKIFFIALFVALIAFASGAGTAAFLSNKSFSLQQWWQSQTTSLPSSDHIFLSKNGDIFRLTQKGLQQVTQGEHVIDPLPIGQNILAVEKNMNYSSFVLFDQNGSRIKTLAEGNADKIENMTWFADAAVRADNQKIAFVSDKDQKELKLADPALFVTDFSVEKNATDAAQRIADPLQRSGGMAHPVWDPANFNILLYENYEYDENTKEPFSLIYQYDLDTKKSIALTTEDQNAFQVGLSPDGSHALFLGRNGDNTVTLYFADFGDGQFKNIHKLITGNFAYPQFSFSADRMYYLQADKNQDYSLYIATLNQHTHQIQNTSVVAGATHLNANSAYSITKN